MDRGKLALTAGVAIAALLGYASLAPDELVLNGDCEAPARYLVSAEFNSQAFWNSQISALRQTRSQMNSIEQREPESRRQMAELFREMEQRNAASKKTRDEQCAEMKGNLKRKHNMDMDLSECPLPIVDPKTQQMRDEVERIRAEAKRREDAVLEQYNAARLQELRRAHRLWLDECEKTAEARLLANQIRR